MTTAGAGNGATLDNPRWVNTLFSGTGWAWLWMMVRLWLGVRWFEAGWHKTSEEAWTGGGAAVRGFRERAVAVPEQGRPPIAYDWYREFLEFLLNAELHGLFGWFVTANGGRPKRLQRRNAAFGSCRSREEQSRERLEARDECLTT